MKKSSAGEAVETLRNWYESKKRVFAERCTKHCFVDSMRGSAYVDFDTSDYISRVVVWDHTLALEIQHIHIETEKTTYPYVGENENLQSFVAKLKYAERWLEEEQNQGA